VWRFFVELTERIEDLKAEIQAKVGIPPDCQLFIVRGRQLEDGIPSRIIRFRNERCSISFEV
jgi:hypothetical protein